MKTYLIIFIALLFGMMGLAQPAQLFSEGKQAYDQKQFQEAIAAWDSLARLQPSPELFYNLGNAYFRNQERGMAMAAYHAALQLNPRHADALHNLRFAGGDSDADRLHIRWAGMATENQWAMASLFSLAWISLALIWIYQKPGKRMAISLTASMLLALTFSIFSFAAAQIRKHWSESAWAVVRSSFAEIHSEPNRKSISLIRAEEGTLGRIVDETDEFWKIQMPGFEAGWIHKQEVKRIRPW